MITLKRQESHDSNDDDDDDDSSVYDEDRDLGDLSEPTEESSSEEEDDNDVEFKPPSRIRTVLNSEFYERCDLRYILLTNDN